MRVRRFAGLKADHPLVGRECPACNKPFVPGDATTLIALGPGDRPEAQQRAREGRAYTAVAAPVHWACATGGRSVGPQGETNSTRFREWRFTLYHEGGIKTRHTWLSHADKQEARAQILHRVRGQGYAHCGCKDPSKHRIEWRP